MKISKRQADNEGADEWIVTYSDMVTLLLAFFILLFSFSSVDAVKWQALVESFTGQVTLLEPEQSTSILEDNSSIIDMGNLPVLQEEDVDDNPPADAANLQITEDFNELYNALMTYNEENGHKIEVTMLGPEIRLRLSNNLLFDSAKANINGSANETLLEIIAIIHLYDSALAKIILEGNTDNLPIHTKEYRDNFELSLERALSVLYYFKYEGGFEPQKLIPMGYGEFNPVSENDTEEGRAKNRRTDIVIVKKVV